MLKKTKVMHIYNKYLRRNELIHLIAHSNNCLHNFGIDCECNEIENVKEYKYLGMNIDWNFDMNNHINVVIKKLRSAFPQIMALKPKMDEQLLRSLYFAFIYPFINYGICAWGSVNSGTMTRLNTLHKKILKKMAKKKSSNNSEIDVYKYWNVMSIDTLFKICFLKENVGMEWGGANREHNYGTRIMENVPLFTPRGLNRYHDRTVAFIMPRILNEIPLSIRNTESINLIKEIKKFYLSL